MSWWWWVLAGWVVINVGVFLFLSRLEKIPTQSTDEHRTEAT